jgi:hypothetical protein
MTYLKVKWDHSSFPFSPNRPVFIYSELDRERWELRKVEIFPNGRMGYASPDVAVGGTDLSTEPLPSLKDIATDPVFEPAAISKAEFDEIWAKATA